MTFYDDEVLSLTSGGTATPLTRAKIDNSPGSSKANRVVLTAYSAPVAYRFNHAPDLVNKAYHILNPGDPALVIDGYDNIVALEVILASGVTTAQLFASYAA